MFNDSPSIKIAARSDNPVFVFCDHATNHIPKKYNNLGLSEHDLARHIAWDIGAETLTRQFCKTYGAAGLLAGFSRLLIDPNRPPEHKTAIPEISDGTLIPGNQNLDEQERQARIETFYNPYHSALENCLDEAEARTKDPLIISIHSFTPEMANGETRELDIGLLWKADKDKAARIKKEIELVYPYKVELNQPYSALHLNHTIDKHIIPRGLRHTTLEVRQDLIDNEAKALQVAQHLTDALNHFIRN